MGTTRKTDRPGLTPRRRSRAGGRPKNSEVRPRGEYLTPPEVAKLITAASKSENGLRDSTMIMLAYRHGLRATELCLLRWEHVDLSAGVIQCNRLKGSVDSLQPLGKDEAKALARLERETKLGGVPWIFRTRQNVRMTRMRFGMIVAKAGRDARIPFPIHPHMLRHACGFKLVNDGVDIRLIQSYLGHRNIQHTVRYTEVSPARFKGIWKE